MASDHAGSETSLEGRDWGLQSQKECALPRAAGAAWRGWLKHLIFGREQPPVYSTRVLEPPPGDHARLGICCSGGGIRSASFNLGALQRLQEHGDWVERARYLAAVSGGAYIASAFSMIAGNGSPREDSRQARATRDHPPFYPGSPEQQYLRNHLAYLAPRGWDKAVLIWRLILGLLINLVLIGSGVTLVATVLAAYYEHWHPDLGESAKADPSILVLVLAAALLGLGLALGAALVLAKHLRDDWRRALGAIPRSCGCA